MVILSVKMNRAVFNRKKGIVYGIVFVVLATFELGFWIWAFFFE